MGLINGVCPLGGRQVVEEYFLENRTRTLDLAAFLDRLARACDGAGQDDYRVAALKRALAVLADQAPGKVERVQAAFSDPRRTLLPALDQKSAKGAFDPREEDR